MIPCRPISVQKRYQHYLQITSVLDIFLHAINHSPIVYTTKFISYYRNSIRISICCVDLALSAIRYYFETDGLNIKTMKSEIQAGSQSPCGQFWMHEPSGRRIDSTVLIDIGGTKSHFRSKQNTVSLPNRKSQSMFFQRR